MVNAIDNFVGPDNASKTKAKNDGKKRTPQTSKTEIIHAVLGSIRNPFPRLILHFGTSVGSAAIACGATALELLRANDAAAAAGDGPGVRVYTFEPDPLMAAKARDLVDLAGLEYVIFVLDGYGDEALRQLCREDMVRPRHVDAVVFDHWHECYLADLKLCEELEVFHVGSVVVADNVGAPGAGEYLNYVKRAKGESGQGSAVHYNNLAIEGTAISCEWVSRFHLIRQSEFVLTFFLRTLLKSVGCRKYNYQAARVGIIKPTILSLINFWFG